MTTDLKNLYEDLIEGTMIDLVSKLNPEIRTMIENAPVDMQRAMILTVLEENNPEHRLLASKIRKIAEGNVSEAKHIKEVVKMIREYVEVSATERKLGEVMTPISLVEEMLDTLPYEVWTNPNLKWLDPCNGVGTFVSIIVERLMKGLKTFQADDDLRYKHIMENMIFTCELQAKNVFLYLYSFDPKDQYALNVYNGSYLDEGFDKHMKFWGIEKFDVIVMNPPYNAGNENSGSAHVLWDKFVIKTLDQLIESGYLVAVHPDGWRGLGKGFDKVKNVLKSKQILYLEVHDRTDGVKTFGVQTAYDFYCLHNVPCSVNTKIKCMDGSIERADLSKMEYIPNGMYNTFQNLIAKGNETPCNILRSCIYHTQKDYVSDVQTEEFKYPCVYTTLKDGSIKFKYSSDNTKGQFGTPKVIFSNGTSMPIVDTDGNYGITEFSYAIIDEPNNLPFIQKAMLNPDFIKLMSFSQGVKHRYNHTVIATFRKDFWKEFLY